MTLPSTEDRIRSLEGRVAELEDALLYYVQTLATYQHLPGIDPAKAVRDLYSKATEARREFTEKGR